MVALLKSAGRGALLARPRSAAGGAAGRGAGAAACAGSAAALGRHLLGDFVLPFELVSVLLLSALIAAIAIVGKDREDEK